MKLDDDPCPVSWSEWIRGPTAHDQEPEVVEAQAQQNSNSTYCDIAFPTTELGASPVATTIINTGYPAMDTNPILTNPNDQLQLGFQSPPPSLPPYGFPVQPPEHQGHGPATPPSVPKASKRRKLSTYDAAKADAEDDDDVNGSGRKNRTAGTKRACNQCRQQKVRKMSRRFT